MSKWINMEVYHVLALTGRKIIGIGHGRLFTRTTPVSFITLASLHHYFLTHTEGNLSKLESEFRIDKVRSTDFWP